MSPTLPFGRRKPVASTGAERVRVERDDLNHFVSAFVGGFIFFSILIL